ncbi:MAG: chloride channel protein [Lentisphaeria bacterium]|nr:chloride channel protein [Lentisphaeria bacterium]
MGRFLLRLRRRSVRKLGEAWQRRLGARSRVVPLAMLIGVAAAVAAAGLHWAVLKLEALSLLLESGDSRVGWWVFLLALPLTGVVLSFLIQRHLGGARYAKSLSPLILALNRRKTRIPFREVFNHLLSSALSVGLGGSAGLEAPSVLTGAAIGANASGFFGLDRRARLLLIGCGAAAAISAIFGSPVGGVLFAVEVLLPRFSVGALAPMLISSAVAMVISRTFFPHEQVLLAINEPWRGDAIPFYFLCGLLCAAVGVFVIRHVYWLTEQLKKRLTTPYRKLCGGGAVLALMLALFPILRGQGYRMVAMLFSGREEQLGRFVPLLDGLPPAAVLTVLVLAAVLLKPAASALTVESGGDGGIFAPAMFIGAFTGFAFARLVNLTGVIALQEPNFVVVGMCGVFSAVLRAPLTGVFLIAEVTGSYLLLVPLMIVSSVAWAAARRFEPHSIYRKALAEAGLLSDDSDRSMLQTLSVRVCVDHRFTPLDPRWTMVRMRDVGTELSGSEVFPVLDGEGGLLGVVKLEQLKPVLFDPAFAESLLVFDLMEPPRCLLSEDDDLDRAMSALERYHTDILPVLDRTGKFMGFVSAEDIFRLYRGMVREGDGY